jgi:hypothetical protein
LRLFAEGRNRSQICEILTAKGYAFRGRDGKPTPLESDDVRRITHNWVEYGGIVMDYKAKSRHYEELDLTTIYLDPDRAVFDLELLRQVGQQVVARSTRHLGKGRRKKATTYPLSSMIYCAHCEALAKKLDNAGLRSRLITRSRGKFYVHRSGIQCGRHKGQVSRRKLEAEFTALIKQLAVDEEVFGAMLQVANEASLTHEDDEVLDAQRNAAIGKCNRKLEAARHLYEDGEISREEYLRRKEANEREIAHWRAFTTETQRLTMHLMVCVESVGLLWRVWEDNNDEDKNRMVSRIFESIVYDLDQQKSWISNSTRSTSNCWCCGRKLEAKKI